MPERIVQNVSGAIDGFNTVFSIDVDFAAFTLKPFLNGQLVADQLFTELPPRSFVLQYAPLPGDSIIVFCEVD